MPSSREERRARIAARRERVAARRARVQARREEAEARMAGLRRVEYVTTAAERPPKEVALTWFGKATKIRYMESRKVQSSWVDWIHLVRDLTTDRDRLAVTFLDGYTCIYLHTTVTDYFAMKAAPSKGKYVWAYLYGVGRRVISAATKTQLAETRRYLAGAG